MKNIDKFIKQRQKENEAVLKFGKKNIKRFFNLDHNVYKSGALNKKTKEMLGLVSSLVLRCDDCIKYHLLQCHKTGLTDDELEEAVSIGLIVGGSITIPHIRRLFAFWEEIKDKEDSDEKQI